MLCWKIKSDALWSESDFPYCGEIFKMGKKDKKGDASDGSSVEEEYVVEKVLDKRISKGKVRTWTAVVAPFFRIFLYFLLR